MKKALANPRSAGIISLALAMPFLLMISLIWLGIEPDFGPLEAQLSSRTGQPSRLGSLFALALFALLIAAFIVSIIPVVRTRRAGGGFFAHPLNLALAVVTLATIVTVLGAFVIDQYPCWIGVPNCD